MFIPVIPIFLSRQSERMLEKSCRTTLECLIATCRSDPGLQSKVESRCAGMFSDFSLVFICILSAF